MYSDFTCCMFRDSVIFHNSIIIFYWLQRWHYKSFYTFSIGVKTPKYYNFSSICRNWICLCICSCSFSLLFCSLSSRLQFNVASGFYHLQRLMVFSMHMSSSLYWFRCISFVITFHSYGLLFCSIFNCMLPQDSFFYGDEW